MEVPLHVKGQTNSGSLMLLFNFSCNCDCESKNRLLKVTLVAAWLLCSATVIETESSASFPLFYIMDVQQRQK